MANKTIDTCIWADFFQGKQEARHVITEGNISIASVGIAELATLFAKNDLSFEAPMRFIQSRAKIVPLGVNVALAAATIKDQQRKKQKKFGLADAIHYATAQQEESVFVTADKDFAGLPGVMIIGKDV